jgi:cytochrome c5
MNSGKPIPVAPARSKRFAVVAAIVLAGLVSTASAQQQARPGPARGEPAAPAKDYDQRALEIYEFRKAARSGPARGEEIYFYKCWMCHNELAQGGAPNP